MRLALCLSEIALLSYSAFARQSPQPQASQLLEHAIEHHWADENQSPQFTYEETWHNRNFGADNASIVDETAKFESVVLKGQPYLRMVEQNGKPLPAQDASAEDQSYDSAIATGKGMSMQERVSTLTSKNVGLNLHLDLLPTYFHSEILGTEILNGRPAIHLECTPRTDVKPDKKEDRKGMQFHLHVWIDQQDQAFARVDAELLKNRDDMLAGTMATLTWEPIDGVWLQTRMDIHGRAGRRKNPITFDTDYTYSNYKRFHTEMRILTAQ